MTFAAPWMLAALVLLPLLGGLYAWRARPGTRRPGHEPFAAAHLIASVQPQAPGWRSHAPVLAALLAMGTLVVAAARPQTSVAVAVERASVMLAIDRSGSMLAKDVEPDRLSAAQSAGRAFLLSAPKRLNVGIMAFNRSPTVLQSPTTDRPAARSALDAIEVSGGTASGDAVLAAVRALRALPGDGARRPPAAIVLVSDGKSTAGADPVEAARVARGSGIPVHTVALGTDQGTIVTGTPGGGTRVERVPPDPLTLREMAEASAGEFFTAADASGLARVYERLGSQLSMQSEQRQVTSWFAGGGLVLLIAAGGMSLRWFGRLI